MRRKSGLAALLGLGSEDECLEIDGERVHYSGLERSYLLWKWSRANRTIHLRDVVSFGTGSSVHPILFVFAAMCGVSLLANATGQNWWFAPGLWRFPYLFVLDTAARTLTDNYLIIHGVAAAVYLLLGRIVRTRVLVIDAGVGAAIMFHTEGVPESSRSQFESAFLTDWARAKATSPSTGAL